MGRDGDLVEERLARGCRCFAVFVEDGVGGYGWMSTGVEWIGEVQLEIAPRPAEGYIWNCFTISEHRRSGVFRSLVMGIAAAGRSDGLKRMWIGSLELPAERALEPSGFKPVLQLHSTIHAGMCWLKVIVPDAAEPGLVDSAREVLGVAGRPLPITTTLRRSCPRRH